MKTYFIFETWGFSSNRHVGNLPELHVLSILQKGHSHDADWDDEGGPSVVRPTVVVIFGSCFLVWDTFDVVV